ncbi:biotin carboxylase (plasmid) [Cylindrospermum stagnale PCC 7417]|uniref:Biotin carboxylase n=1 Tax=Cylindrospermum stagnale PCC 7417 TaxID=56107 RepID=K9X865_9NOST|nr:ATP-grasp domain-containing protein [Cylindrospermum stagnale]AFZ28266.1 biotin carboxylase [Cylindrospermum stagnale PCC 7417]
MKNQASNFILYLDTRSFPLEREEEIKSARNAGLNIAIAASSSEPYKNYNIDHFIQVNLGQYDIAEEIIVNDVRSNNLQVKGVVAWGDISVELASRVGTALNLASTKPEAVLNVRNKANTRRLLTQLASVNPKYAIVHDYNSFSNNLETVGIPCLLKPSGASFGRGIFKVDTYELAEQRFQQFVEYCTPSRDEIYSYFSEEFLLEEYLNGTEHSVAGMVADSQVYILAITDKKINREIPFQYENIVPSKLVPEIQNRIVEIARLAVQLMGINWCGFHIDIMVTDDGPKILEIGGRLGGECINSHLIPLSSSFQLLPYDLLLQVVQGNNPFTKVNFINDATKQSGMRAFLPPRPGRIVRIEGFERVRNHPNTRALIQLKEISDEVFLPIDKTNEYAVGYVIAQCEAGEKIEDILDELSSLVQIETE